MMSSIIGKKIDQYRILKVIGHGGVASVFLAHDENKDRDVALKILPPSALDDNIRTRFQREAELLFQLNHPNIVKVLDYGLLDGTAYIVLPYFEAGTLKDRLAQGPLSPKEGARIISQLASALQYAHDEGIIHRDVKPSNVLFDQDGTALLTDFGFAHLISGSVSLTGSAMVGTPAYMSPEQIQGKPLSPQTDQYALGVMLYEISTGTLPFSAETPMAVAIKHAMEPLPPPAMVNPNLPVAVEHVIIKALAKEPIDRFSSIQAMNEAFQNALLQSINPSTGKLRPGALVRDPLTIDAPKPDLPSGVFARAREKKTRWVILLAFFLALMACPLSVWAGVNLWPQFFGREQLAYADATRIYESVLATANAQVQNTLLSPEEINTAVAQTLQAAQWNQTSDSTVTISVSATPSGDAVIDSGVSPTVDFASATETSITASPTITSASSGPLPSATPLASPTSSRTATITATITPTITASPSPVPTNTPTQTPTPVNPCTLISIGGFNVVNKDVHWTITNSNPAAVVASGAVLSWPSENGALTRVKLGSVVVWTGSSGSSPSSISFGATTSERSISSSAVVEFHFSLPVDESGYSLSISFTNGCVITP